MADIIQIRRDLAANWTSADPTLAQGEMGYETDTGFLKFGDGSTAWTSLAYFASPTGTVLFDAVVATADGDYTSVYDAFNAGAKTVYVRKGTYTETNDIVIPDGGQLIGETGAIIDVGVNAITCDANGGTIETTGTLTYQLNSTIVLGAGTTFTNLSAGDFILLGDAMHEIASVTNDTSLVLTNKWEGEPSAGNSYWASPMYRNISISNITVIGSAGDNVIFARGVNNLTIDKVSGTKGRLYIQDSYHVNVTSTDIRNSTTDTADVYNSLQVSFRACTFDNAGANGIYTDGDSRNIQITDCTVSNCTSRNIRIDSDNTSLTGCTSTHCDLQGIYTFGANLLIENCKVANNGGTGIYLLGDNSSVINNNISDNGNDGIQTTTESIVVGNQIRNNAGIGVNCFGNRNVVSSNVIDGNGSDGIDTSTSSLISGNMLLSNGGWGIKADGLLLKLSGNQYDGNVSGDVSRTGIFLSEDQPPSLTTTERDAISSPNTGYFIWNETTAQHEYYNGASWVAVNESEPDATTTTKGIVELATDGESAANVVVQGNDSRLSDARTPTAHSASHTDGTDDIQVATASQKGLATATQITKLDAITGTNTGDEVAATESVDGIAELATQAETDAGTDDNRIVTPLKLKTYPHFEKSMFDAVVDINGNGDYTSVYDAFNAGHKTVYVRKGSYTETNNIIMPDGGQLVGEIGAIIDLGNKSIEFDANGGVVETAGTISVTNNTTAVTGVGTTFTNLSAGDFILLGDTMHEISSITNDTALVIIGKYYGETLSGEDFWATTMYQNIYVANVRLVGTAIALDFRGVNNFKIENVKLGEASNLTFKDAYNGVLTGTEVKYANTHGMTLARTVNIDLTDCIFDNNNGFGIYIGSNNRNISIDTCTFSHNDNDGIRIASDNITITGCTIQYNIGYGVYSNKVFTVVANSQVRYNGKEGLYLVGANGQTSNNNISFNDADGLRTGAEHVSTGNYINDNEGNGITIATSYNTIVGNVIENNLDDGIDAGGAFTLITGNVIKNSGGYAIDARSNFATINGNYISGSVNRASTNLHEDQLPRLTGAERNAITSPMDGFTIWNESTGQHEYYDGSNWVDLNAGTFADIYVTDASTAQSIPTGTTPTKITAFTTDGQSKNCTAAATSDKITITKTGRYLVNCSMSFSSGTANVIWSMSARLGGTNQTQLHFDRKVGTANDVGVGSLSGIIDVTVASTDLDVATHHDSGGNVNLTVTQCNLSVMYLGET